MRLSSKKRIIEQLRDMFPDESWSWDGYMWVGTTFNVQAYSQLTPQHDSDDETAITVYHRSDSRERLLIWR